MTNSLISEYNVKTSNGQQAVRMLSGGNIQKVIVAREFTAGIDFTASQLKDAAGTAKLIVANQPTRGIDVGATEFIRKKLVEIAREKQIAVLMVTADLNEALETSDSIIVMSGGEIVAYFPDASKLTEFDLGEYMLGLKKQSAQEILEVTHEHESH